MAAYIATGTTELAGSDFTLTDGQTAMLNLTAPSGSGRVAPGCRAKVEVKTSDSVYVKIGDITADEPAKLLAGPGTYRAVRMAAANTFGVDKS